MRACGGLRTARASLPPATEPHGAPVCLRVCCGRARRVRGPWARAQLNALNADLAQQPEELQHAAAQHAAVASADIAAPPPPPPPPPEKRQSVASQLKQERDKKIEQMKNMKFKPPFAKKTQPS